MAKLLEARQSGVCAICGRPPKTRRLAVDHCHKCKKRKRESVRGLLCHACNRGLFGESPVLLRKAASYFEAHLLEGHFENSTPWPMSHDPELPNHLTAGGSA